MSSYKKLILRNLYMKISISYLYYPLDNFELESYFDLYSQVKINITFV